MLQDTISEYEGRYEGNPYVIFKIFLDNTPNLKLRNEQHYVDILSEVLRAAVSYGFVAENRNELIDLLMSYGADPFAKDTYNHDVFDYISPDAARYFTSKYYSPDDVITWLIERRMGIH